MANTNLDIFKTLQALDLSDKHKTKGEKVKLTYLPWSSAWTAVKMVYPDAKFDVVRTPNGIRYWTDGRTCWVETTVTINDSTQNETLAVMNNKNEAIPLEDVTATNVDKSIKRCLVKNLALFGLDINIWEGEELSDVVKDRIEAEAKELSKAINDVIALGKKYIEKTGNKEMVKEVVAKHNEGNSNPNSIKELDACTAIVQEFESLISEPAQEEKEKKE